MTNSSGNLWGFSRETNKIIETTIEQGKELRKVINENKRSVDIPHELHYIKQLLMKILAHVLAERAHYGLRDDMPQDESKVEWVSKIGVDIIKELNEHYAKAHFNQDEINDIKNIIEEAKKFK